MEFKKFVDTHWELLLDHLCQFHPLEHSFIERFHEELNWNVLSQNTTVSWNRDFIAKWEQKWLWHVLAMNPAILWNDEMIKRFKKRLDTYYLVRNVNLPLSDEFIQKHLKTSHFVENNNYLTPELRAKYRNRLLPIPRPTIEPEKLTELNVDELSEILDDWKYSNPQPVLYEKYILPNLISAEKLFETKFDYKQRWFYISPIHIDIHGLTPSYKGDSNNPFEPYNNNRNILNHSESSILNFIPDSGSEGPDRMFEVLRSNTVERYAALLVSENIKRVLSKFTLPKHKFFQTEVKAKKVNPNVSYFVLQFDLNTIYHDINFPATDFKFRKKRFSSRTGWKPVMEKIKSLEEIPEQGKTLLSSNDRLSTTIEILPTSFTIESNYDVFTLDNRIIVNEFVKETLESNFPNQIKFQSAQLLNIFIEQKEYVKKELRKIPFSSKSALFSVPEVQKQYIEKRDRLEKQNLTVDPKLIGDDEFNNIQFKLNAILPDNVKHFVKSNEALGEYTILSIDQFYQQNEYASTNPESFKAVIIGENGVGDSIGLMLEKDHDYKLQEVIYEFLHETGEIQKYHLQI